MKTYPVRIFPTIEQIQQLNKLSTVRNSLWNYLIDLEQQTYETTGKIVHNYEMDKHITSIRKNSEYSNLNSKACQRISKEVFSSYRSFFELIKKDKSTKTPKKVEDINKFHTIVFNQSGWLIKNDILTINKIPFRFKSNLDISKLNIKEIKIKLINNKFICDICVEPEIKYLETLSQTNKVLGVDLGLKTLGTCIDNKGNVIVLLNKSKKISKYYLKQISKVNKKIATKSKNSKKYKELRQTANKLYNKKNKQIKHTLHTQSKNLLSMNYHTIVIGDLSVKKLMEQEKNKYTNISKSFHNSNINMFLQFLTYKSYLYNTNIVKINEQHTTQLNCLTGKLFKDKIELSDRSVKLSEDIEIDRDLNAAINILERYFNNHLASMTEPLDKPSVIEKFNLFNKPSLIGKPTVL